MSRSKGSRRRRSCSSKVQVDGDDAGAAVAAGDKEWHPRHEKSPGKYKLATDRHMRRCMPQLKKTGVFVLDKNPAKRKGAFTKTTDDDIDLDDWEEFFLEELAAAKSRVINRKGHKYGPPTMETREAMSDARKKFLASKEGQKWREAMSDARKKFLASKEGQKWREAHKKWWASLSPKERKKIKEAMSGARKEWLAGKESQKWRMLKSHNKSHNMKHKPQQRHNTRSKASVTASMDAAVEGAETLQVMCGELIGTMDLTTKLVTPIPTKFKGKAVCPTAFEKLAGMAHRKNWQKSLRVKVNVDDVDLLIGIGVWLRLQGKQAAMATGSSSRVAKPKQQRAAAAMATRASSRVSKPKQQRAAAAAARAFMQYALKEKSVV